MRLAVEAAQLGVFEFHHAEARVVWVNERNFEIHGWPSGRQPTLAEVWDETVFPEDRNPVRRAFEASIEARCDWRCRTGSAEDPTLPSATCSQSPSGCGQATPSASSA